MNTGTIHNDTDLINILKKGGRDADLAFYTIYQRYANKLNAYCMFRASNREDAEEIFQDTWLKFEKSIKSDTVIENLLPYLIKIARNLTIDYYRKSENLKNLKLEYHDNSSLEGLINSFHEQNKIENDELISIIKLAITTLNQTAKEAFVLRKIEGLDYTEIAEICGESSDTIRQRVHRATLTIKEYLSPIIKEYI